MKNEKRTIGNVGPVACVMIAWWAALSVGLAAHAQMLPFVPDPVTTPEFVRYADMLDLSKAQRLAALDVHDAYRTEFRGLEDGQVRTFVQDLTGLARVFMQSGWRVPARSEFEQLIEQFDEIIRKANTIDRMLMDRLTPLLTEDQLGRLPSVRVERELDVYAHLMDAPRGLNPAAPIVLSAMVRELDRGEEEIARTEGLLRQYERNALQRTRKLYRLLKEAAELALDTIDRIGVRDMTVIELMQLADDEAFEADIRVTFDEGSIPLQAELFAASQQNLALLRQLMPLLSRDNADALRHEYYRAGYGRVYQQPSPWRFAYQQALALESLDTEREEQIRGQQDQFRRQEDQLVDRMVLQLEAWREYRTVAQLEDEERSDIEERITAYREDRERVNASALVALAAILSEKEWRSVEPGAADEDPGPNETIQAGLGGGGDGRIDENEVVVEEARVGLPQRRAGMPATMSIDRRNQLARLARLDEGGGAVLEALFDDYRADYAAALELMIEEETTNDAEDDTAKEPKVDTEQFASRMATLAAIDDAFFDSAGLVLEGEAAERALALGQRLRARERATAAAEAATFVFGREEAYTDFVGVVFAMEQSVEIVAATRPTLDSYGETVKPLVDERLAAARETQKQFRLASRAKEHGRVGRRMAKKVEEKAEDARRQVKSLDVRIRDQNRQSLADAQSVLGDDLGWTLRVAYQRAAYPEIYEDEFGMDDAMAAARGLDDLTASQGAQVDGIISDYRARFSKLSERMVRLRGRRDFDFTAMQMPSQKVIEGEIELERLRFDRREAASRALLRLRLVLTDPQILRCGLRELPTSGRRAFE